MSYIKVAIILEFSGEYYGIKGHYLVKPKRTNKVAHSTHNIKQRVKLWKPELIFVSNISKTVQKC